MPRPGVVRIAAIVLLALIAAGACRREQQVDPGAREAQLRQELTTMRDAIRRFHAENGRYPYTLEELVPKFLPSIPVDPMTGSAATWRTTTEETVEPNADFTGTAPAASEPRPVIIDVQSGAGDPYSSY